MAWGRGAATGLDDLCVRLRANDPKLQSLTLLKHRKVDDGEIRKLCDSLQHNTCLTELYASNHAITPAAAALVAGLLGSNTTLAFLCIGNSGFGDDGVTALSPGLSSSKSLRTLDLESKSISARGAAVLSDVLSQSCSLQKLSLARNPLTDEGAVALCQSAWKSLTHLDVSACQLGAAGVAALSSQQGGNSLTSLSISHNSLTGSMAGQALKQLLGSFKGLKQLRVRDCQLSDESAEALAEALAHHPALEHLDVAENACSEAAGAAFAAALGTNSTLRHLDLGSNRQLSASAVQQIANAASSRGDECRLSHLDLTGISLQGEAGVSALDALSRCPLQQLCLLGTGLGSEGSTKLVECFDQGGFASLQELSVSACNLELETGLQPLLDALLAGKAPSLKVLECGANPACQGDVLMPVLLQLREARAELQVHWSAMDDAAKVEVAAGGGAPQA